jgi:two-component system sensor histidine kinase UhpB
VFLFVLLAGSILWISHRRRRERNEMLESRRHLTRAAENERKKLAADLHDGPIQELQLLLGTLTDVSPKPGQNGTLTCDRLRLVSDQLRGICSELRPPILHHFGLPRAARACLAKVREQFPALTVHESIDDFEDRMTEEQRVTLYRALQEALANVGRHAMAENVWIRLSREGSEILLMVRDDGRGFDLPKRMSELEAKGHLGLSFLSQRVEAVGAVLRIVSSPGAGASLCVTLSLMPQRKYKVRQRAFATSA